VSIAATLMVGCGGTAVAFVSVYSASRDVQRAFQGDLTRLRLSELTEAFAIELGKVRGRVFWPVDQQVLAGYDDALTALKDYGRVWDVERRMGTDALPAAEVEDLLEHYGIRVDRDSAIPVFSGSEALGQIGDAVLDRLRRTDRELMTGERPDHP
jgi:hypothetical protein